MLSKENNEHFLLCHVSLTLMLASDDIHSHGTRAPSRLPMTSPSLFSSETQNLGMRVIKANLPSFLLRGGGGKGVLIRPHDKE